MWQMEILAVKVKHIFTGEKVVRFKKSVKYLICTLRQQNYHGLVGNLLLFYAVVLVCQYILNLIFSEPFCTSHRNCLKSWPAMM